MVEYTFALDNVFSSLADPTRRDILQRVSEAELTVSDIALPYDMSLAAVSKHIKVLESANLVIKRRRGKQQMVILAPGALRSADDYLEQYRARWQSRFENLDALINEGE